MNTNDTKKCDVVIIDDDESIREGCKQTLEAEGFSVAVAVNGLQGLRLVEKLQHELPAKHIIPALSTAICSQMKRINLEKIVEVLEKEKNIISVPEEIAEKAEKAVIKMLELS